MKTIEVEIEVIEYFAIISNKNFIGMTKNIVVPNVSYGIADLHECDILVLTNSNYATEIEIKVTIHDLLNDKKKKHGHYHSHIARLFFAVPVELQKKALEVIPKRAGLFVVHSYTRESNGTKYNTIEQVRNAKRNKNSHQWTEKERYKLLRLGAMRILGMKKKILTLQNKIEQAKK